MDWQLAAQRHAAESLSGTVYHRLRGLIQQRAKLGALAADQALGSIALSDPRLFVLTRGDSFIAVHNFSDQRLEVELATIGDGWKLFAINDDVESAASSDSVSLVMPAYGVRWLQRGA
uniref:Sucrose hydrolase-like C-terminal domain-containing protein n=2 Tax=Xanthomonas vasicola TaxID=56459 RepID=A0A837APJ7_XANVA